jgi:hypothetical protein
MRVRFTAGDQAYHIKDRKIINSQVDSVTIDPVNEKVTCTLLTRNGDYIVACDIDQDELFKYFAAALTSWKKSYWRNDEKKKK